MPVDCRGMLTQGSKDGGSAIGYQHEHGHEDHIVTVPSW